MIKKTSLSLKNITVSPPLFSAPLAGVTHSAFRRLVSDFGGYGAMFTEMLSGKALLHEKVGESPFTKKRNSEGLVWYQLALNGTEDIEKGLEKLEQVGPAAIDLNAGCPAPEMEKIGTGVSLFADLDRLKTVVTRLRKAWSGVLTVKCRLWKNDQNWKQEFATRIKIIEDCGVDAVTVHPRFFDEKLKRKARWEFFPWVCEQTKMPVIANGDIRGPQDIFENAEWFYGVSGIMIGRQAVVRPWMFNEFAPLFNMPEKTVVNVDYAGIWQRYYEYVTEDFRPEKAIGRLKEFTKYYSCNFFFGQQLKSMAQSALTLETLHEKVTGFLKTNPRVAANPAVSGL